jgi:hypothetical protein
MKQVMRIVCALAAAAALALAQPKASEDTLRVIELKSANARSVAEGLGAVTGGMASVTASGNSIIVRGNAESVRTVEEAVLKLEAAAAAYNATRGAPADAVNVELTVHLLYGSAEEALAGEALPQDLEPTVRQLRSLFPYKSYQILDSLLLRGREGQDTFASGALPMKDQYQTYRFRYRPSVARPLGEAPRMVHLSNLDLQLRLSLGTRRNAEGVMEDQWADSQISTSLDAREGQKTVVGKSNVARTEDAIILVVTPRVVLE